MSPAEDRGVVSHVLFCVADQWRADALGCVGAPGVTTPHLDALAADGVTFTNHWCQASPCGPSRSSLLTGTHLPTHGQWTNDEVADHGLPTLAGTLGRHGVKPILVGYTDTPQPGPEPGPEPDSGEAWQRLVDPDFEVARPFIWQLGFPHWRAELASRGVDTDGDHPFGLYAPDGEPGPDGLAPAHYSADDSDVAFLTDGAIDVLDRLDGQSLLHVNWLRPHPPMTPPRPYHRLVDPDDVELPVKPLTLAEQAALHPYFEAAIPGRSLTEYLQRRCRIEEVDQGDDRLLRAAYYGLVAEVDAAVGRLVAALRRTGLYDSTLIIVTSDHGDALGDHWLYGRQGPFDGHFRVPCIVRDPRSTAGGTRGSSVDDVTANVDLFPTICDALGIESPATVEGRSLADHLAGHRPAAWRRHVRYDMSWHEHLRSAVRSTSVPADGRFTVVRTADHRLVTFPSLPPLLFDLTEDPDETANRAGDPVLRPVEEELAALSMVDLHRD